MNKAAKTSIALLATFGTSLAISTPLIILASTKNKNEVTETKDIKSRYRLSNWIINQHKDTELFSYFFSKDQTLKNQLSFSVSNINKSKIKLFFKSLLFDIFKYSPDDTNLNLKIDYEINEINNECKMKLNWYFVSKKHNLILKNTKYYDILMLYF